MITSPGYGSVYPLGVSCDWILDSGHRSQRISVKVTEMDLEDSDRCTKDNLVMEDIGGRQLSAVNQDPFSGALVVSSRGQNLLDYYWRMVSFMVDHTHIEINYFRNWFIKE